MRREVYLIGGINKEQIARIGQEILGFYDKDPSAEITLYITSDGGNPHLAMAFYDIVRIKKIALTTIATGECSSSALVVLLAGSKRKATQNTLFLEHQLARGFDKDISLNPSEMHAMSVSMGKLAGRIRQITAEKTGRSIEEIQDQENKEVVLTAEEAKKFGFIEEII